MNFLKKMLGTLLVIYLLLTGIFYFAQEYILFPASRLPDAYNYKFNSQFRELSLQADDGARLNALHFEMENPRGLILYFHGNAGDLSRWGEVVEPMLKYNHDILIVDYRGYGKSTGKRTPEKMYADAELVYHKALKLFPEEQIVLYGRSMGGTFASYVAARYHPRQLILEAPFYSLQQVVQKKAPILPVKYLLRFKFPTHEFIGNVKCPISFIHGTHDQVVPYRNSVQLYEKATRAALVSIENGTHNNLTTFDQYWRALDKVLE